MRPELSDEWIAEEDLAEQLNVSRETLRSARLELAHGEADEEGPWVVWKKTAAARFAAGLGLQWPPATASEPEEAVLTVASAPGAQGRHFPNPRIIRARKPDGTLVDVLVMRASNFTPTLRDGSPMTFRARRSPHGPHWQLVGREPRFRGQW